MARMHARTKGKAGSTRPYRNEAPDWMEHDKEFILQKIEELRRQGLPSAMIGVILRDQYGIPDVRPILGKKISKVMKEHKVYPSLPEDLLNLFRRAVNLYEHLKVHKSDKHSRRGYQLLESKIRRLIKYYKRRKVVPEDFKFDIEKAKLIVERK